MIVTKLDYLQFTFTGSLERLDGLLNLVLSHSVLYCPDCDRVAYLSSGFWSGKSYERRFKSARGFEGGYSSLDSGGVEALVVLSGTFLSQVVDQQALVKALDGFEPRITRVDIALDDYDRRVSFAVVREIADRGDYALCEYSCTQSSKSSFSSEVSGDTVYFGSPNSSRRLRFYNAEVVHSISADRWEGQFRNFHAEAVFNHILTDFNLAPLVTGIVDFVYRQRDGGERYSRCDRYPFWESLRSEAGGSVRLASEVRIPDFERTLSWIDFQCGPAIALVVDCLGLDYLLEKLPQWRSRQSAYHRSIQLGVR